MKRDNIKDGRLVYQMGKNDKWKDTDMISPAFEILDYYRDHSETIENFILHIIHQKHTTVKDKRAEQLYYKLVDHPELIDSQEISDLREALTIGLKWIKKIEGQITLLIMVSTDSNYSEEYLPNRKEEYWKKHLGRTLKYKKTNLRIQKRIKELAENNASESD